MPKEDPIRNKLLYASRWVRLTYSRLHVHQSPEPGHHTGQATEDSKHYSVWGGNIQISRADMPVDARLFPSDRVFSACRGRIIFARSPPIPCRRWPLSPLLATTEQSQPSISTRRHATAMPMPGSVDGAS
jgi:hypothetical protein